MQHLTGSSRLSQRLEVLLLVLARSPSLLGLARVLLLLLLVAVGVAMLLLALRLLGTRQQLLLPQPAMLLAAVWAFLLVLGLLVLMLVWVLPHLLLAVLLLGTSLLHILAERHSSLLAGSGSRCTSHAQQRQHLQFG
jgi:hypothetical protein